MGQARRAGIAHGVGMTERDTTAVGHLDWKLALVRLVEVLRWPVAVVVLARIFREPLYQLIAGLAHHVGS